MCVCETVHKCVYMKKLFLSFKRSLSFSAETYEDFDSRVIEVSHFLLVTLTQAQRFELSAAVFVNVS